MEYHTVYQYLQVIECQRKALAQLPPAVQWKVHAPAVMNGFRRIRALACSIREAEYLLIHRVVQELETELAIIKERLVSCPLD